MKHKNAIVNPWASPHDRADYWERRCKAAERFIAESPGDPDIYPEQIEAHREWMDIKKEREGRPD